MDSISVEALDLSVHDFRVFRHYFKLLPVARRPSSYSSSKTLAGHTYPALARESIYLSNRSPIIQHLQIYNGPLPTSKGPKLSPFPEDHFGISFIGLLSDTGHMGSPFLEATEPDGNAPFFQNFPPRKPVPVEGGEGILYPTNDRESIADILMPI